MFFIYIKKLILFLGYYLYFHLLYHIKFDQYIYHYQHNDRLKYINLFY